MTNAFVHEALLYNSVDEYVDAARSFVRDGLQEGSAVMIAAPAGNLTAITSALGEDASRVRFADMAEIGLNPGRIIPTVRQWLDETGRRPARFMSEPVWPGRREVETVEAMRHEALMNLAFTDVEVSLLCPYDARTLDTAVIESAERTHPTVRCCGEAARASAGYLDPAQVWSDDQRVQLPPPRDTETLVITRRLADLRRFVARHALNAHMPTDRIEKLVLAACEGATNALLHGDHPSLARVWTGDEHLICEIINAPTPVDPLAGRLPPDATAPGGRGLWMINQLCDLVELRATKDCTSLRMHMSLPAAASAQ